ncbi:hypothetical protein KVT40_001369 [Elsinoe batatas]|uniref:Uncharacterized protein n=1 Tax=Elsinoe batatas TaxID=2601811 RepID=A0A8K0L6H5_9PEZI|nr:hypothetical protein KVT40_001369 [Elsinoe batatas]
MALDLNLASSFDRLLEPSLRQSSSNEAVQLMKRARTWFDLVVLAKILQVDAGDLLGFSIKNVRRCRSLLNQPYSTALDTRLFSQVELNHLRAKISNDLLKGEESLDDIVTGARLDLSVWYDDWKRIVETSLLSGDETPSLLTNLAIQWHWADAMTACTAFRLCGNNNMEGVTAEQRAFLQMTQSALHLHLDTMLANPEYLDNFKYAMDFVWAKGTYCFLLMLKLSFQLEDSAGQHALLAQGQILHDRLTTVAGQGRSKIYLQLLAFTMNHHMVASHGASPAVDDYVPDEFVFDWDFPVLNLSSSMASQDALLDQFLADDDHLLMETLDTFWAQTGDVGIDSRRSGSRAA